MTALAPPVACLPLLDHPAFYQLRAREIFERIQGRPVSPLSWVYPWCGTEFCLSREHLALETPRVIAYPEGVCVYCGEAADTRDHLLPRSFTGDTERRYTATVPACRQCNSAIGDREGCCITDRRRRAHDYILRKYAAVLEAPDRTGDELDEFGPTLRAFVEATAAKRTVILDRLAWPRDPNYDVRAFLESGIGNPAALGLI